MAQISDRELLEQVAGGTRDAFTVLYRRFERPVFGMLFRLAGGRRPPGRGRLQEAFTRVWLGAATHDPLRGEVRPWIYKIALNTARSEMARKRYRTPTSRLDEAGIEVSDERAGRNSASPPARRGATGQRLALALHALPDFMREVVVLRLQPRASRFAQIAEGDGRPRGDAQGTDSTEPWPRCGRPPGPVAGGADESSRAERDHPPALRRDDGPATGIVRKPICAECAACRTALADIEWVRAVTPPGGGGGSPFGRPRARARPHRDESGRPGRGGSRGCARCCRAGPPSPALRSPPSRAGSWPPSPSWPWARS
jgi:DNA-directed RNA polymerase specialized sigma24 family protein